jgi:predicted DNA-binding transcriptional regulator AlpA
MGMSALRSRLGGISRQRVDQLTHRVDFPKPIARLVLGRVWLAEDVEAWMRVYREAQDDDALG